MSVITTERHGDVLVIISNNPPVNALGAAVRTGVTEALDEAEADASVTALVLACDGRTFFAGADITEFGKPPVMPQLPEVVDRMARFSKPIVAAIHGTALGGGCEMTLGCHYRIAVPSAKIGTPEVKLGLLPGAGGTQRLPRVAGVPLALEMTSKGDPISATRAKEAGLVDRLAGEDSLRADAIAFANEVAGQPIPRIDEMAAEADPDAVAEFQKTNARKFAGFDAPAANIACVVKATESTMAEGLQFEREQFMKLMFGTQSAAMRHLFFAERQAAKIDDVPADTPLREIKKVGVIGAGTMGGGIAMNFVQAGIPVVLLEMSQEAADRGRGTMLKNWEASARKGRFKPDQLTAFGTGTTTTLDYADLGDCDLIIEAVFETMEIKKEVFGKLDAVCKPGAILASNTSYLDIDEIAACTGRPGDVVGMHFFSPANVMKLLEVVRGKETADDVLATVMALAKRIKKVAVVSGVCYGFIGNRMLMPRQVEANKLLLEGASPAQIDKVHTDFGMPMGPFQMADLAGVDIGWHRDPNRIENVRDALAAEGRWGQKKSAGFYDYDDKRKASESPRVAEILADFRAKTGTPQRQITDEEITERTLYPMVNEGALILEEGIAQRASDIDVVWIYGYGWPVYRGGPMLWADTVGAKTILAGLEKHADKFNFEISSLLREKAEKGERFTKG